jgi:sec-independent protein translocase protein TatA
MFGLGPAELIIIAVLLIFIFGAKKIPDIGKGLGGALRELKKAKKELSSITMEKDEGEPDEKKTDDKPGLIEEKIKRKVIDHVPVVKKAVDINEKVKKVKEVLK